MTQPNELTITISRLPDNSAFTVEATERKPYTTADRGKLLAEVLLAIDQHTEIARWWNSIKNGDVSDINLFNWNKL